MGHRDPGGSAGPKSITRRWAGEAVAILASGPSLTEASAAAARITHDRVVAVNDSWRIVPAGPGVRFAVDLIYACDGEWWDRHIASVRAAGFDLARECWTQDPIAARQYGLRFVPSSDRPGLSLDPATIHQGGNSGFQALNLAVLMGASRVSLYGFDMQRREGRTHWFGEHPEGLRRDMDFERCARAFDQAAPQLRELGVAVTLRTRSALKCFPCAALTP